MDPSHGTPWTKLLFVADFLTTSDRVRATAGADPRAVAVLVALTRTRPDQIDRSMRGALLFDLEQAESGRSAASEQCDRRISTTIRLDQLEHEQLLATLELPPVDFVERAA